MKLQITFKTPNAIDDTLDELQCCNGPNFCPNYSCPNCEETDDKIYKARELLEQYIKYGELITIEFDTENGTATVIKNG